jgi:hypothetical protein
MLLKGYRREIGAQKESEADTKKDKMMNRCKMKSLKVQASFNKCL